MEDRGVRRRAEVNLLPAYLINGEDQLKRETVLKRLRSRLEAMGDLDFNCDTFDGKDALGGDIVAACNTMPFRHRQTPRYRAKCRRFEESRF